MWWLGACFSGGLDSAGITVGISDLKVLPQPKLFCGSLYGKERVIVVNFQETLTNHTGTDLSELIPALTREQHQNRLSGPPCHRIYLNTETVLISCKVIM